jgi:hypothetical protein
MREASARVPLVVATDEEGVRGEKARVLCGSDDRALGLPLPRTKLLLSAPVCSTTTSHLCFLTMYALWWTQCHGYLFSASKQLI